jgi:hypothetical protein
MLWTVLMLPVLFLGCSSVPDRANCLPTNINDERKGVGNWHWVDERTGDLKIGPKCNQPGARKGS